MKLSPLDLDEFSTVLHVHDHIGILYIVIVDGPDFEVLEFFIASGDGVEKYDKSLALDVGFCAGLNAMNLLHYVLVVFHDL